MSFFKLTMDNFDKNTGLNDKYDAGMKLPKIKLLSIAKNQHPTRKRMLERIMKLHEVKILSSMKTQHPSL